MEFLNQNIDLVVYKQPVNMHRSFNGLVSLAITELELDLSEKTYILFMNRKRNQFKILFQNLGQITIYTMRIFGSMQMDFTKIDKINTRDLRNLIFNAKCRNRLKHILEE